VFWDSSVVSLLDDRELSTTRNSFLGETVDLFIGSGFESFAIPVLLGASAGDPNNLSHSSF